MIGEQEQAAKWDSVREICTRLHRARLSVRLYPPGHPTVSQTLDALHQACLSHLERWGPVASTSRNRVFLVGESGELARDPEVMAQLERLLVHPEVRVRREVVRTLSSLRDARAGSLLVRASQDEDSSVRTLAVRGLSRYPAHAHFQTILDQVKAKSFDGRSAEEIQAFLDAVAALAT